MGRYWTVSCPYCKAEIARGNGYGDKLPQVWAVFIRCELCGGLVSTGVHEFLTIPPEKRLKIRASSQNTKLIEQSLDRTNSAEYLELLKQGGFEVYPLTDDDYAKFSAVDFKKYDNVPASAEALQQLYNLKILVDERERDETTGGIKKDVLQKNQQAYAIDKKANGWSAAIGLITGFISCAILGSIDPKSYLFLVGVLIGVVFAVAVNYGIRKYYEMKENPPNANKDKLDALKQLYDSGIITQDEYKQKVMQIIDGN